MIDKDLNQKPVPYLKVELASDSNTIPPSDSKTNLDGTVEFSVLPGNYKLTTPDGIDFQGHHYAWDKGVEVGSELVSIDLTNDNALITDLASVQPTRKVDDLTALFQKYEKSVGGFRKMRRAQWVKLRRVEE